MKIEFNQNGLSLQKHTRNQFYLCLFLFFALPMSLSPAAFATWTIDAVDAPKDFYLYNRAIAIDRTTNLPHLTYGKDHLYHAYFDGVQWQYETVDSSSGVGNYASIAIDSNNRIHISYYDSRNNDLKYATNLLGSWVISTVDSADVVGQYTSIAIDSNNKVHISYYDSGYHRLKYATNASGSWIKSVIDSSGNVGQYSSISTDSNNSAHISYYDETNYDLKYATNASGPWVVSVLDSAGRYSSIAVDSNDSIHISYYGNNYDLKYTTNVSGSWSTSIIDPDGWAGYATSIAIDSNDKVHISYYDNNNYLTLRYATNASGSWVLSAIESTQSSYLDFTAVTTDASDKVHITYYSSINGSSHGEFKYATNTSGSWVASIIDIKGKVGNFSSIAIDSNDKEHISYYDIVNAALKYANNASGPWTTSIIDSAARVGEYTSIAIDSDNKVHISYFDNTNTDLKYATNASGSWVTSTIDTTGYVGEGTSIALDSGDKAHISYYDSTNKDLKYATNASGPWVTSTIDSTGSVGEYNSIAIDSSNKAHISYYNATNSDLKYATNVSGSWVTSIIYTTGQVGGYTSIATDSNNKVHISFYDFNDSALRYADNVSGSWAVSGIDFIGDVGRYTSITIDLNNKAHISYYDYFNSDLKYATNTSGPWITSIIDSAGNVGQYTSISLDSDRKVHISYYDETDFDLMYATNVPPPDNDADTYTSDLDCNDNDADIHPGAVEICNGKDDNCNGTVDEGVINIYYRDFDNDTYGNMQNSFQACSQPAGHVDDSTDCNDANAEISPAASESCDAADNNCNGQTDEGLTVFFFYRDADGDGYGNSADSVEVCLQLAGYVTDSTDCNDNDPSTSPGSPELCDAIDNNCNGQADEGLANNTFYRDTDGDNYGNPSITTQVCAQPSGYVADNTDCNDIDPAVNPGVIEITGNCKNDDCNPATADTASGGGWLLECVDNNGDVGRYSSIAVDASGTLHVSYYDYTNTDLKYATNTSGSWVLSTIDSVGGVGQYTSIAIDSNNKAHISYYDYTNGSLKYATNSSGSWVTYTIDLTGFGGQDSSIAVDSNNRVHISYSAFGYLKYVTNQSGPWVASTIGSLGGGPMTFKNTSIAVDSNNNIHISYITSSDISGLPKSALIYATNSSGDWILTTLIDTPGAATVSSQDMAIDPSGNVHVSCSVDLWGWTCDKQYCNPYILSSDLKYVFFSSGSWNVQSIDNVVGSVNPSIASDFSGNLHISFWDYTNHAFLYITNSSGSWVKYAAESLPYDISDMSNAFVNDSLQISYYGYTSKTLNHTMLNFLDMDKDSDGFTENQGDCDDSDPIEHPDQIWYLDADGDGYSEGTVNSSSCARPSWYKAASELTDISGDCDDSNAAINPSTLWHPDNDGDGHGNPAVSLQQCSRPLTYILDNTDCNDSDINIYSGGPGARVPGAITSYYWTLQEAYGAAGSGDTIQAQGLIFAGDFYANHNKTVTIEGGYDCGYSAVTGFTAISGKMTFSSGSVIISNILIE